MTDNGENIEEFSAVKIEADSQLKNTYVVTLHDLKQSTIDEYNYKVIALCETLPPSEKITIIGTLPGGDGNDREYFQNIDLKLNSLKDASKCLEQSQKRANVAAVVFVAPRLNPLYNFFVKLASNIRREVQIHAAENLEQAREIIINKKLAEQ